MIERRGAVRGLGDVMAVVAECANDEIAEIGVVFGNQNSGHRISTAVGWCAGLFRASAGILGTEEAHHDIDRIRRR